VWQAAELLETVVDGGAPADRAAHAYFRSHPKMGARDRDLVARLVYGVLHRPRRLAAVLEALPAPGAGPGAALPAEAAPAQRQRWRWFVLAYLLAGGLTDVQQLERLGWGGEARALAEAIARVQAAALPLAVRAELPDALAEALAAPLGAAGVLALGEALHRRAPVDLRINPLQGTREAARELLTRAGFPALPTPYSPVGLRIEARGPLFQMQAFQEGGFEVQDEGSQLIAPLLAPRAGGMVVDFCAGAGGKTLHLATLMCNRGAVWALDVSAHRLGNLRPRLRRAGLNNIRTLLIADENDPALARWYGQADGVLVDAPCTGTGTLRRNPEIAWRPLNLPATTAVQRRILAAAARLVKPGGRLVYATCSLLPGENQEIAAAFLRGHPQFRPLSALAVLRGEGIPAPDDAADGPYLRLLPHRHGTDGFFAAVLERAE
jgi:16S rRNA (cytosine967-C5)-methyltransferase